MPSILDLIPTNDEQLIYHLDFKPPIGKSDHIVISASIQLHMVNQKSEESHIHTGTYINLVTAEIHEIDWQLLLNVFEDPDEMSNSFYTIHTGIAATLIEKIRKNPMKPWINEELLSLIYHRSQLWR